MSAIVVSQLGKAYKQYPSRWARLAEWIVPFSKPRHVQKWVMQDVSFTVNPGEAVGIIGINGAGKSTLLKMITGTTQPTTGGVQINGRVAALLELGMGFHQDFTGRQNAYMAGQLLGYKAEEITQLMPEIESFADIGDYIDQPLRVYSSGMQVRLAFSVAVAKRPDVLIVDEALAVGDVYFQQKCYKRIRDYNLAGTTLLFVTHDVPTVLEVCTRVIYLYGGKAIHDGSPKEAVDLYQADILVRTDQNAKKPEVETATGSVGINARGAARDLPVGRAGSLYTDSVTCLEVSTLNKLDAKVASVLCGEQITLKVRYQVLRELDDPHIGFKICNRFGVVLFETNTYCMAETIGTAKQNSQIASTFTFPMNCFQGEYTVTVGLTNGGFGEGYFRESLNYLHDVLSISVLPNPDCIKWGGVTNLQPKAAWTLTDAEHGESSKLPKLKTAAL